MRIVGNGTNMDANGLSWNHLWGCCYTVIPGCLGNRPGGHWWKVLHTYTVKIGHFVADIKVIWFHLWQQWLSNLAEAGLSVIDSPLWWLTEPKIKYICLERHSQYQSKHIYSKYSFWMERQSSYKHENLYQWFSLAVWMTIWCLSILHTDTLVNIQFYLRLPVW